MFEASKWGEISR